MNLLDKIKNAAAEAGLAPIYQTAPDPAPPKSAPSAPPVETPITEDQRAFLEYRPALAQDVPRVWEYPDSDDGRAACFLEHFGNIVRFCPELKGWRVWHGHRWHNDTTGRVGHFSQLLSRSEILAAEKYRSERDGDDNAAKIAKVFTRKAEALGNESTINAMLIAAARFPRFVVPLAEWDAHSWLAGVENGVLDLKTRKLIHGRPGDYMTKTVNVRYNPSATCPRWEHFVDRILPGELGAYIQRLAGYSLSGNMDDAGFYFCFGTGKNGKSILLETFAYIFGDYAGHARGELIEESRIAASPKHDLAALPGIRFLHSEETTDGARFRAGTLKSLATGETLTGERKYKDPFEFRPQCKLWVGGNHKPRLDGADFGLVRRLRLIPFSETITAEEEIPREEFLAILRAEAAGILNWMLQGLATWTPGLRAAPAAVREASAEYARSEDELGDFIEQCTQDADDNYRATTKKVAYDAYLQFASLEGNKHPLKLKTFTRRLGSKGWTLDSSRCYWRGKAIRREENWGGGCE